MEQICANAEIQSLEKRRWFICLPLACAVILVYFHRFAMGVVSDSIIREFGITQAAELGLLSSVYFYTYAALQVPAGIFADFCGPRRTVTVALAVAAFGTVIFAWSPTLPWLYGGRLLIGIGVACIFVNTTKIFAEWFRSREFGTMNGLANFIGNAGFVLATSPLAFMVETTGWRTAFYIVGIITLLVAGYCWWIVRDNPTGYGWPSIRQIEAREGGGPAASTVKSYSVASSVYTVFTNIHTWPPFIAAATAYSVFAAFGGVPYFMQVYGMSRLAAAHQLIVLPVGYMLGGPVMGFLSDRMGSRRIPFVGLLALAWVSWLVLTLWNGGKPPSELLIPLFFSLGVGFSGASFALTCSKEVNPPETTGVAIGLVNMGPFIGAAIMQPLFGLVLDLHWLGVVDNGLKLYLSLIHI